MASKTSLLIFLFVIAISVQLGSATFVSPVTLNTSDTIYCTLNGGIGVNGTATPPFPNALVELQRRVGGGVVASAITNPTGTYIISVQVGQFDVVAAVTNGLRIVVRTPLSQCNPSLPSTGRLVSNNLRIQQSSVGPGGRITIILVVVGGYTLNPNFNN